MEKIKFTYNRTKVKFCPCGKSNKDRKFAPFHGCEDEGYCHSCGKTFFSKDEKKEKPNYTPQPEVPIKYVDDKFRIVSMKHYDRNVFVQYLQTLFNPDEVQRLINLYSLGTTNDGGCIFWQIDADNKIRTGKVIYYNPDGHRDKERHSYFVHLKLGIQKEAVRQCLFGLHLLSRGKPIGLVEAEKTAVVMAGKKPQYTWMATGGKTQLKAVYDIRGKKVVAFPDSDAFEDWKEKLSPYGFKISEALQKRLSEPDTHKGIDLADVIPANLPLEYALDGTLIDSIKGYPVSWA